MAAALRRALLSIDGKVQKKLSPTWKNRWNHPAGPKTVHFWSPVVKWVHCAYRKSVVLSYWYLYAKPAQKLDKTIVGGGGGSGLVIAGASDFARPVESLSLNQSLSLALTGTLWARYCLVIIPKNYFLCSCNVFLGAVGTTQVGRILLYRYQQQDDRD